MLRGEVRWAELDDAVGSEPGFRRPVLLVQSDPFNRSRIATVVVAAMTSNLALAEAPGNVRLTRRMSGLKKESVVNVSQLFTLDRAALGERVGRVPPSKMAEVDAGLRLVLAI
jgi:mRNA interferase MazF